MRLRVEWQTRDDADAATHARPLRQWPGSRICESVGQCRGPGVICLSLANDGPHLNGALYHL